MKFTNLNFKHRSTARALAAANRRRKKNTLLSILTSTFLFGMPFGAVCGLEL